MLDYNFHTHTRRCHHAMGKDEEYVECALDAGIKTLGFSDHVPYPFEDGYISHMRMSMGQLDDYVTSISRLKESYKNDINILIGFEAEYFPSLFDKLLDRFKGYPIDYLIMGQHFLDMEAPGTYFGNPFKEEKRLSDYVDQVIKGLSTGKFTYLAHPDLPCYVGSRAIYKKHMKRLCEYVKKANIPLEINGLGISEGRHYPNTDFVKLAKDTGCRFVLGLDAHTPFVFNDLAYRRSVDNFLDKVNITLEKQVEIRKVL